MSILETEPGYVISGVSGEVSGDYIFYRLVLTSIDDQGNQLWWKTYGEDFHNYFAGFMRGCIQASDGGFVISGSITDSIRHVGLLIKFDEQGDSLWSRIYGDTNSLDYTSTIFKVCAQLPDQGFIIAGSRYVSGDDADILLMKTDSLGNLIWEHTYGLLHVVEDGYSIAQLPEGEFLIGIDRQNLNIINYRDPGLLKIDNTGNLVWIKYYGTSFDDGHSVVFLSQDGNYIVGSTYAIGEPLPGYPQHKVWIFKTDTAGNVIWERKYSDTTFTGWCSTIEELGNGDIIVSGGGAFAGGFGTYGWILKTKGNGDSLWMRRYSYYPTYENYLNDLRITSDQGMIITGVALGDPDWEQSIWVQKLDSIGCDSVMCDTTVGIYDGQGGMGAWGHGSLGLYPNPASDRIHIIFRQNNLYRDSSRDRELEIVNIFGEKVAGIKMSIFQESYSQDISSLAQGLYLVVIREGQRIICTGKFLIAR